jgi:ribose transport system permease protein
MVHDVNVEHADRISPGPGRGQLAGRLRAMDQAWLILVVTVGLVCVLAASGVGVLSAGNLAELARSVGPLLILGTGAAVVILGRGIDLSAGAAAAVAVQMFVWLITTQHVSEVRALVVTFLACLAMGAVNGVIILWLQVPALLVTLATWQLYLGAFRLFVSSDSVSVLPPNVVIVNAMGSGAVLGVPTALVLALVVVGMTAMTLRFTTAGWFYRAVGDNEVAAALTGIPVRPLRFAGYVLSSVLAGLAGLLVIGRVGSFSTAYGSDTALLFDALTIAIIGGFSLAGGRGRVFGVVAAAALVVVIQNGMTLLNFTVVAATLVKGLVLLAAIALDAWLHPEDEETIRAGDL